MAARVIRTIRRCREIIGAAKGFTPAACRTPQSKAMNSTASSLEIVRHVQELALLYPQTGLTSSRVEDHQVAAVEKALDVVGTLCEVELDGIDPLYVLPIATHLCSDDAATLCEEEWELLTSNSQCHKDGYFITAPIPAADRRER